MTREEANARLAELNTQMTNTFNEAQRIAREHKLDFTVKLGTGMYQTNLDISPNGTVETWETSDSQWNDSGCSDWDDSTC
jgi:hypothetical protein